MDSFEIRAKLPPRKSKITANPHAPVSLFPVNGDQPSRSLADGHEGATEKIRFDNKFELQKMACTVYSILHHVIVLHTTLPMHDLLRVW